MHVAVAETGAATLIAAEAAMEIAAEEAMTAVAKGTGVAVAIAAVEGTAATAVDEEVVSEAVAEAGLATRQQSWLTGMSSPGNPFGPLSCSWSRRTDETRTRSVGGSSPQPDAAVTNLEDRLIKGQVSSADGLASQMAKADIRGAALQARSTDVFPLRPAFGTNGQAVTLWANYFNVNLKPTVLYKYTFEFAQVGTESSSDTPSKPSKPQSKEVKGRKLYFAVRELLSTLKAADKSLVLATEFKSQLVSLQKLKLAENPVRFRLPVESSADKWDVIDATIHGPTEAPLDALLKYVATMNEGPDEGIFPKHPDVIDALNVVLGHGPRSKLHDISAVGSARFFPFGSDEASTNLFQDFHQLIAARGFFQSARLGTGRLLLNANVSHGVFRAAGKLADLFDRFGIQPTQAFNNQAVRKVKAFAKFMPKTRVWADIILSTGEQVRRTKSIHGIVSQSELSRQKPSEGKPLKFVPNYEYPGPKQVQFFLDDGKGGGRYISVFDYFKMSESRPRFAFSSCLSRYPIRCSSTHLGPLKLMRVHRV